MESTRESLLTPEELCSWLRIPRSWIYQHVHSKTLPFAYIKVGRYVRFPESGILEYLAKQGKAQ
jgi:excisionase family DNA binding protein